MLLGIFQQVVVYSFWEPLGLWFPGATVGPWEEGGYQINFRTRGRNGSLTLTDWPFTKWWTVGEGPPGGRPKRADQCAAGVHTSLADVIPKMEDLLLPYIRFK